MSRRSSISTVFSLVVVALMSSGLYAPSSTFAVTYVGPNTTNADTWNVAGNWSPASVPTGAVNVVIPAGKLATAWNASTPTYTGNLNLDAGAALNIGFTTVISQSYNALGTPGTTIVTMASGSSILTRMGGTPIFPAIVLTGDASITLGNSTQTPAAAKFNNGFTGAFGLTVVTNASGSGPVEFNTNNGFSSLTLQGINGRGGSQPTFQAKVTGSLGTGNVTVNPDVFSGNTPQLEFLDTVGTDAMANSATLFLNGEGPAGNGLNKIKMSANETIGGLWINGVKQISGAYNYGGGSGLGAAFMTNDVGTLTVLGPVAAYWDLDGAVAGAGGTAPSGTWDSSNTFWNSAANGTGSTAAWTAGQTAYFAAGSGATGTYGVNVVGTQDIGGLAFEEGTVTLSGNGLRLVTDVPVYVASGASATLMNTISEDAAGRGLHKSGAGTLVISGNNTYTGVTAVGGGVLSVSSLANAGAASNIGQYATAGANGLILGGGTFRYTGATTTTNRGITLNSSSTIDVASAGAALSLGASTVSSASTLNVIGGANSSLSLGPVTLNGAATFNPTSASLSVASVTGTNMPITLSGSVLNNVISGVVSTGTGTLTKTGSSEWTLNGVNTYTGATAVQAGTLIAGTNSLSNTNGAFGKATTDINLGLAGGNSDARILIGGAYTVGRNIRLLTNNTTDAGTRVLTLGGNTAANSTFSGNIFLGTNNQAGRGVVLTAASGGQVTFSGVIQDPTGMDATNYSVTKMGLGKVILTNTNTYTGTTVVNAGTLLVTGSTSASSAVTVNGGTLGGTGNINGTITLNAGGKLSPGASIESLNSGSNTWNGGAGFVFEFSTDGSVGLAGSEWDLLAVNGSLDLSGASDVNPITINLVTMLDANNPGLLASWNPSTSKVWGGFVTTTSGVSSFDPLKFLFNTSSFQNPLFGTFSVALNGNNLDLVYTPTPPAPEPSTAILAVMGLVGMTKLRRRKG